MVTESTYYCFVRSIKRPRFVLDVYMFLAYMKIKYQIHTTQYIHLAECTISLILVNITWLKAL